MEGYAMGCKCVWRFKEIRNFKTFKTFKSQGMSRDTHGGARADARRGARRGARNRRSATLHRPKHSPSEWPQAEDGHGHVFGIEAVEGCGMNFKGVSAIEKLDGHAHA